jgi:hypothetical protein
MRHLRPIRAVRRSRGFAQTTPRRERDRKPRSMNSVRAVGLPLLIETEAQLSVLTGPYIVAKPVDPMHLSPLDSRRPVPQATTPVPQNLAVKSGSRIFGLITGTARVGLSASVLAAGEITSRSIQLVRVVLPAGIAEGPLDAIERQLGRRQHDARKSEQQGLDDVAKAAESALNRVVIEIVDRLDMEELIDHVPINRVVARIDLPAVIDEIDLSGIVREGTKGLGGETLDSTRAGLMAMDQWSAHLVDKVLRRKSPRDLTVTSESHPVPAALEALP